MEEVERPTTSYNSSAPRKNRNMEEFSGDQLHNYEQGFSDDESYEDAIDNKIRGSKSRKVLAKGKKSPRCSEDDGSSESNLKTKKPRIQSLFGEPITQSIEDADDEGQPRTPGNGIRMRMSSLSLDHQGHNAVNKYHEDNGEGSSRQRFDLGATLGLSDAEKSPQGSPTPSEHSSKLEDELSLPNEDPVASYGLRKNIDRTIASTTWVDVDQSGNYDPYEEKKQNALKASRSKARKKKGKYRAAPKPPLLKYIVRLPISAIGTVLNITNGDENWPEGHSVVDSEEEELLQSVRAFYRHNTPGVGAQDPIEDPKGEYDDLTGHPVARGCTGCRNNDQDCSAIKDRKFPCAQCARKEAECRPIVRPKMQYKCQRCKESGDRQSCSFETTGAAPGAICEECFEAEAVDCIAETPTEYRSNRVDMDEIMYGKDRKWVSCTHCRMHRKRCSLKRKSDKPPCRNCKKHKIGCTFYDTQKLEVSEKAGKSQSTEKAKAQSSRTNGIAQESSAFNQKFFTDDDIEDLMGIDEEYENEESESEDIEMEDAEGRNGILTTIQTSFAHPIQFNTVDATSSSCAFCEIPFFEIVGHWEKEVHVLKWNDNLGYTELAGGHRETQDSPTIMCQECVMARVQIMFCPTHEVQPIQGLDSDYDEAVNQLLNADAGSSQMRHEMQRWCSMCFSLASYVCCASQPSMMDTRGDDESLVEGCGLRLCDSCETTFRNVFGNDVDSMATAYEAKPKAKEDDLQNANVIRADVGFLRTQGLLMLNVGVESGETEDEGEVAMGWDM